MEVEGFSIIPYKDKRIYYVDYSALNKSKEKTIQLITHATQVYVNLPQNSVLALVNTENGYFDMDTLKVFKAEGSKTAIYEKKVAVIGVKRLIKVAYDFVVGLTNRKYRLFDTKEEALEWLVSEKD